MNALAILLGFGTPKSSGRIGPRGTLPTRVPHSTGATLLDRGYGKRIPCMQGGHRGEYPPRVN